MHDHGNKVGLALANSTCHKRIVSLINFIAERNCDRGRPIAPDSKRNTVSTVMLPWIRQRFNLTKRHNFHRQRNKSFLHAISNVDEFLGRGSLKTTYGHSRLIAQYVAGYLNLLKELKEVLIDTQAGCVNHK